MPNVATAYVQVVPTTENFMPQLREELGAPMERESTATGEAWGAGFGAAALKAAGAAAIAIAALVGKTIKDSVNIGAELEQNLGGTEAVFGEFADKIGNRANAAYKNMGLSASEYMATANKIGSLLQGAGFENNLETMHLTANAMQRAADVASVMGIETTDAMAAIAGAAKGNFTMMDNLGVAMNATTIEAYAASKGMKNFKYSAASNAEKIALAFEMFMDKTAKYEGNFSREAQETISGSLNTMKSEWKNILGSLALGEDITPSLENLSGTIIAFVNNAKPAIINAVQGLPTIIEGVITTAGPVILQALGEITWHILNAIATLAMDFLAAGYNWMVELTAGISEAMAEPIQAIAEVVNNALYAIAAWVAAAPGLAMEWCLNLAAGINSSYMNFVDAINGAIASAWNSVTTFATNMFNAGNNYMSNLGAGISAGFDAFITAIKNAILSALDAVKGFTGDFISIGSDFLAGIATGIGNAVGNTVAAAKAAAQSVVNSVKSFFRIASPSKLMKKEVGLQIMAGWSIGMSDNVGMVTDAIDEASAKAYGTFESDLALSAMGTFQGANVNFNSHDDAIVAQLDKLERAILSMKIVLDTGKTVGGLAPGMDTALGARNTMTARGIA